MTLIRLVYRIISSETVYPIVASKPYTPLLLDLDWIYEIRRMRSNTYWNMTLY